MRGAKPIAAALAGALLAGAGPVAGAGATLDWPVYGGEPGGDHYSPLKQIHRGNLDRLRQAWRVDMRPGGLQTSPIVVGRTLYAYTPTQQVIALDAATGAKVWTFDSGVNGTQPARGLTYWRKGREARLFAGVMNELYALDPATGRPIASFGKGGRIDLREGLRGPAAQNTAYLTSPGVLYGDLIIVGHRTAEAHPASPGTIRAFDVRTGKERWRFNTIPQPGEYGYDSWPAGSEQTAGGANNWAGMVVDEVRGIVFVPTGSAVNDFYGPDRPGQNLFANSLLALDARTGRRLWHFQAVHHDIWDRDFPTPPVLLSVRRGGRSIDAVAQGTKHGVLFVFERATGKPLFPIEERPFPKSEVPGEWTSPTQPMPLKPAPFARQRLTEEMLSRRTPEVHAWALERFRSFVSGGPFVPFSAGKQTVVMPGFDGGAEWGGPGIDRGRGVIFINANDIAWTGGLAEARAFAGGGGEAIYEAQCAACHGADRKGFPPTFPSLADQAQRLTDAEIGQVVRGGRGRMPGFPWIQPGQLPGLIEFIRTGRSSAQPASGPAAPLPDHQRYRFTGFNKFYDPEGYPAVAPPWGTLNAIDLNTGEYRWKVPLGYYPELAAKGKADTGSENYGGPVVTASGLLFIGATIFDRKFRAFDVRDGKLLWQADLPYSGVASPATYMVDGKQYVVIATSGARDRKGPQGSAYVAFALKP